MSSDFADNLIISRNLTIDGGLYPTEIYVARLNDPDDDSETAVTICQTDADHESVDQVELSWAMWDALEDHVGTIKAIYENPDRGTPAYAADHQDGPELPEWAQKLVDQGVNEAGEFHLPKFEPGFLVTVVGAGAGTADGPGEPGRVSVERAENDAQRNVGHPGGQCHAQNTDAEYCWLPDGHRPVRWKAGNTSQHAAGHVTAAGELFWAGA